MNWGWERAPDRGRRSLARMLASIPLCGEHLGRNVASLAGVVCLGLLLAAGGKPSTIGVDEIKPGMKGYGLTVFRGTQPERFDVEVIDVQHGFRPDQDMILIRTPHKILDHAHTVKGMSGSPIYFKGRLAGAYAYGWGFGLDPVAGVTPIKSMMQELYRPLRLDSIPGLRPIKTKKATKRRVARRTGSRAVKSGTVRKGAVRAKGSKKALAKRARSKARRHRFSHHKLQKTVERFSRSTLTVFDPIADLPRQQASRASLTRVDTPLLVGGMDPDVVSMLAGKLDGLGFDLKHAGGKARKPKGKREFVDGGAIGVQMIRGDINMTGVGTVTHVGSKNRVIAFGHPMMNIGESGLPTATARVLHILASGAASFKIAEVEQAYGTLVHDRPSAIVIDTGVQAATIPVHIKLKGLPASARQEWKFEIAEHPLLTPMLLFSGVMNAIKTAASDVAAVTYTVKTNMTFANNGKISFTESGFMNQGPADMRALSRMKALSLTQVAYMNPFEDERVTSIALEFDLRFDRDYRIIDDVRVPAPEVEAGTTLPLRVKLRSWGNFEEWVTIPFEVPKDAAGKTLAISVQPESRLLPEVAEPESFSGILDIVKHMGSDTKLAAVSQHESNGMRFKGHLVKRVPGSVASKFKVSSGGIRASSYRSEVRVVKETKHPLGGSAGASVKVLEKKEGRK